MNGDKLSRYFDLVKQHPHLFVNDNGANALQVILDEAECRVQQALLWEKARKNNEPEYWYDIGVLAEDKWVFVLRDLVRFPNGKIGGYIRILNRASQVVCDGKDVVILPLYNQKVLLLHHFRHDDRRWHWEAPRGFGEKTISPEDNARKEMSEETGLSISRLVRLNRPSGSWEEPIVYFFAETHGVIQGDAGEGIEGYRLIPVEDLDNVVTAGDIDDFFTCKAILLARMQKLL